MRGRHPFSSHPHATPPREAGWPWVSPSKTQLRARAKRRRARLGRPLHGEALLPHWPDSLADLRVAGYYPIQSEFDCRPLLQTLRYAGCPIGLPRMVGPGRALVFHGWEPRERLVEGAYGVREPAQEAARFTPDVILVPLLAFDARGGRLGYGGGFYDRTLAAHPAAFAVGVAFDEQEVEDVPVEAHDRPLDAVLTPSGLRDLGLKEIGRTRKSTAQAAVAEVAAA